MFDNMTMGNAVTALMGLLVLVSVVLISLWGGFMIIPIFVGIMAIQSAFTGFCPAETVLRKYNLVK